MAKLQIVGIFGLIQHFLCEGREHGVSEHVRSQDFCSTEAPALTRASLCLSFFMCHMRIAAEGYYAIWVLYLELLLQRLAHSTIQRYTPGISSAANISLSHLPGVPESQPSRRAMAVLRQVSERR
jgi:hypothetical protein